MKIKKYSKIKPAALAALGVFLGRGAQADTIIDFDTVTGPNNAAIDQSFGDFASASSDGVTVTGFGTPNIDLTWTGFGDPATRWEYYNDPVWSAGQLNHSIVGTANEITFTPNNATARVVVKSFNFHPYYAFADYNERFTYDVTVLSGTTVLSGPIHITFQSDGTKNHPVNLNYTGTPGQTLKLRMSRVASTLTGVEVEGFGGDIAVDDITFAQLPTSVLPAGPQVVSTTPTDDQDGISGAGFSYLASITNGVTTLASGSIKLKVDGNLVSPTITTVGGLTNVSYSAASLLVSGSAHLYTLTYADNLAATYTNEVAFKVAVFPTLPASWASPPGSGSHPGFIYRTVAAPQDTTNTLDSTIARAKAQLAGTLIDTSTGLPYTNAAPLGTNADGSYNVDGVLNFVDSGGSGNFPFDTPFPGLDPSGYDWFSTEATLYLDLPAGYYRLGVNSDDGFEMSVAPPLGVAGSPLVLGLYDNGRSPDDTLFDFQVTTAGIYNFNLIYFESQGGAECELYSVKLPTGDKILVNDLSNVDAIRSYRVIPPRITSSVRSGTDVVINWAYGNPPFQVQFKNNITGTWSNSGAPTSSRTAHVPIQPGAGFIRVMGSP
jgi:hypothetical protein